MGFTLLLFKEQKKESNDSWFQNIANNQLFIYFMWKSMFLLHEFVRLQCVSVSEQKLSLLPFFFHSNFSHQQFVYIIFTFACSECCRELTCLILFVCNWAFSFVTFVDTCSYSLIKDAVFFSFCRSLSFMQVIAYVNMHIFRLQLNIFFKVNCVL